MRKNNRDSINGCGFVFAAAQMTNRKKTTGYHNDTENYSIQLRTTVNLTTSVIQKNKSLSLSFDAIQKNVLFVTVMFEARMSITQSPSLWWLDLTGMSFPSTNWL